MTETAAIEGREDHAVPPGPQITFSSAWRAPRKGRTWPAARRSLQLDPQPILLNLHGNSSEPVDVTLSDGTRAAGADTDRACEIMQFEPEGRQIRGEALYGAA